MKGLGGPMLDYLIKGGTVVDGTGAPGRVADVGVRDGRIVAIAIRADRRGRHRDVRRHRARRHARASSTRTRTTTPSCSGTRRRRRRTSTASPRSSAATADSPSRRSRPDDADYIRRMMAKVEGMPLAALENGVDWSWETFAEYLDRLEGNIGVNAGFLVGHCALRRYVMGEDAVGNEADARRRSTRWCSCCTTRSRPAASGSRRRSRTPTPTATASRCRRAGRSRDELLALCTAVGEHEGTTLEGIVDGCLDQFTDDEIDLFVDDVGRGATDRSTGTCSPSTRRAPTACRASSRRRRRAARPAAASWR